MNKNLIPSINPGSLITFKSNIKNKMYGKITVIFATFDEVFTPFQMIK